MKIFKLIIASVLFTLLINSCDMLESDCPCEPEVKEWTSKMEVLKQDVSGVLAGYYQEECSFVVYEEFVETSDAKSLVCCIWPPQEKSYNNPFPFPWPGPFPLPTDIWPFSFDPPSGFSSDLKSAISSAPNVFIVDMPMDATGNYDVVTIHIKVGEKTFSGEIDLWKEIYTNQAFYKFMREQDASQFQYNWLKLPVEFQSRLADEAGFSKNSIGRAELPMDCTYGGLMLWESGYTDNPYLSVDEAKRILDGENSQRKARFWKFLTCLVVTAGSDLLSPAATTAVGSANASIIRATN